MVDEIMSDQLEKVVSDNKLVFVDCFATWCHPCKVLSPILEGLVEKYGDRGLKVVKIDVDNNREFSMKNRVSGVPSVFVFSEGRRVVFDDGSGKKMDRLVGVMPEEIYAELVESLLGGDA
ncbi:MAG: thiol reductase thioredoxin [Candidatus Thorarchaeota archaeon]|nr:MAG: thiol reductase thioredoxin [Candidatus Thorarchaeota archaeon]